MEVSAKTKKHPTPVKVNYTLPEKCADLVKAYGEDVVGAAARGAIVISLQAFMRRHIEKGSTQVAIQDSVSKWRPDVRTIVAQSAFEKASSSLDKLSPEERKALLARLQQLK